jgi:class 3 adenylate cyclase
VSEERKLVSVLFVDIVDSTAHAEQHRVSLGRARYETGDDEGAAVAYREAADVIRSLADSLTPDHAASFLDSEPVRDTLATAG